MLYKELVKVYEALAKTSKRLEKTEIIADFLKEVKEDELQAIIYLLNGNVFPLDDDRKIGFSSRLMIKGVSLAAGVGAGELERKMARVGDLGKVAEEALGKKTQATLFSKSLTAGKVIENIRKLASLEGEGTVNRKINLVVELLSHSSGLEARYIVNTVLEKLRVGIAEGIIRDAIAKAYNVDTKEVERAADLAGDYGEIAVLAREGRLDKIKLEPGRAVKCMLALIGVDFDSVFEALGDNVQFEQKLDGFRLQCHFDGKKYWLYTRRMENVTKQFPDVVEHVKKYVNAKSFIIDCEAVGYDRKTKRYLPFQSISQRIKRKHNVHEMAGKFPVELNAFDVVYYNGESLMNTPLERRREVLEKIINEKKWEIILTKKLVSNDRKRVSDFFENALREGHEGLMAKKLDSLYKPGRYVDGWMKIKNVLEPLDLVVVKAEYGEGKRAGWLTSFTLGCRDGGGLLEVGKASTGVKEKNEGLTYKEMTRLLKPLIVKQSGKEVSVKPKVVLEVGYEEIQKSPSYSSGYALRFPRVLRERPDRDVHNIDSLKDVERIYGTQRGKK